MMLVGLPQTLASVQKWARQGNEHWFKHFGRKCIKLLKFRTKWRFFAQSESWVGTHITFLRIAQCRLCWT